MDLTARPAWRPRTWLVVLGALVGIWLVLATVGSDHPRAALVGLLLAVSAALFVILWAVARTRRQHRLYEESLTAWAAERAAQEERLRIARELHDLASHGLGLITVRAAAARGVAGDAGDEERRRALADIEEAGRAATAELRRMLAVLRAPGAAGARPVPLRPPAALDDLPAIIDEARAFGPDVTLRVGDLGVVSAGMQAAACAIVREALANVVRHAGPAAVEVRLDRDGGELVLTVSDAGPVPGWEPHSGTGHGLAGVRERVAALGGTFVAGTTAEAGVCEGFRVEVRLPCGEEA
ncbi:sensor histidine kinase [Streptomyces sp. NPDC001732]